MNSPDLSFEHSIIVPAGGVRPIASEGNFFLVIESNTPVEIARTGAPRQRYDQGDWEETGAKFDRLEVFNPGTVAAKLRVYIGFQRRGMSRMSVMEPPTLARSIFAGTMAAGAEVQCVRAEQAGDIRRKAVLVANGSSEVRLQILDDTGEIIAFVSPEQVHTFPVSRPISVKNPTGAGVEAYISEIIWVSEA